MEYSANQNIALPGLKPIPGKRRFNGKPAAPFLAVPCPGDGWTVRTVGNYAARGLISVIIRCRTGMPWWTPVCGLRHQLP